MKIALIEDNVLLCENIKTVLTLKAIEVETFFSVEEFEEHFLESVDVLVMDINLPRKSGLEYLEELRQRQVRIPIVLLTSQSESRNIVAGFEKGADDYISKPFNFDEFVARLHAVVRRSGVDTITSIQKCTINESELEIDHDMRRIKQNGKNIYLPTLEFDLLAFLLKNRGKIIDRATIYEEVWGEFDKYQLSRSVDVYIGYLRKKLGKDIIKTQKSEGYFIEK